MKTYLWGICSISLFRHASVHIGVSGRLAVEAGIDSWVVIPLIPHEALPSHLPSLDIDPAAARTAPVSLYHARWLVAAMYWAGHIKKSSRFDTLGSAIYHQWL